MSVRLLPLAITLTLIGCDAPVLESTSDTAWLNAEVSGAIPVGFDRRAWNIVTTGAQAQAVEVPTSYGVLAYAGADMDGGRIAYTSLGLLGVEQAAPLETALKHTLDELVPTGQAVVEDNGGRGHLLIL